MTEHAGFPRLSPADDLGDDGDDPTIRVCAGEGCERTFPVNPTSQRKPRFCPEHRGGDASPRGMGRRTTRPSVELAIMLTSIGELVMIRDQVCGTAIVSGTPNLVEQLDKLAASDPRIRKYLTLTSRAGGWVGVAGAAAPILAPIIVHHMPKPKPRPVRLPNEGRGPSPGPNGAGHVPGTGPEFVTPPGTHNVYAPS